MLIAQQKSFFTALVLQGRCLFIQHPGALIAYTQLKPVGLSTGNQLASEKEQEHLENLLHMNGLDRKIGGLHQVHQAKHY